MLLIKEDKEELALALLLWRDFKCQGQYNKEVILQMLAIASRLEIKRELEAMMAKLPPMQILPR